MILNEVTQSQKDKCHYILSHVMVLASVAFFCVEHGVHI